MANLEDVQDLIQEILDNPKLKHVADRLRQEYHDEPILQTASQMQRLLPRPLVEAKRLMRNPAEYHYNYRQLFYQQAKLLEDFTDDFSEQASFSSCYPCYRDMNDRQLRTYFTWRTKVRQGIVESTSPSYAELYCYELLHQIGVPDPETGFRMLQQFRQDYTAVSPECRFPISRYGSMTTSFTTDWIRLFCRSSLKTTPRKHGSTKAFRRCRRQKHTQMQNCFRRFPTCPATGSSVLSFTENRRN